MSNVPDNYDFFQQHEAEQDAKLEKCPVCSCCGDPIQDEYRYVIGDESYCEDCMIACFRVPNF
nr:MAG TPA: Four and a half LIM, LIM domain, PROTEIN BINDING [Caudoviricetes sp.]